MDAIKEYFNIILPKLEPYLLITNKNVSEVSSTDERGDSDESDGDNDEEHKANMHKKQPKLNNIDEDNIEYLRKKRLIRRILRFLGKLGGHNQALLFPKRH